MENHFQKVFFFLQTASNRVVQISIELGCNIESEAKTSLTDCLAKPLPALFLWEKQFKVALGRVTGFQIVYANRPLCFSWYLSVDRSPLQQSNQFSGKWYTTCRSFTLGCSYSCGVRADSLPSVNRATEFTAEHCDRPRNLIYQWLN